MCDPIRGMGLCILGDSYLIRWMGLIELGYIVTMVISGSGGQDSGL